MADRTEAQTPPRPAPSPTGQRGHAGGAGFRTVARRALAPLALAAGFLSPCIAQADGAFLQFDIGAEDYGLVATETRGALSTGLLHNNFANGSDWTLTLLRRVETPLAEHGIGLNMGVAVRLSEARSPRLGLKAVIDRYTTTSWGSLFLLAEVNTLDAAHFALAQMRFGDTPFGAEISLGGDNDGYSETTGVLTYRWRDSPVSLRAGYKFDSDKYFVGFSINTF